MVSRRSTQSVTHRSKRQGWLTRRPRRLVAPKTVDDTVGLSRKEERELKQALYASLQETRHVRTLSEEENEAGPSRQSEREKWLAKKLRKSTRHISPAASASSGTTHTAKPRVGSSRPTRGGQRDAASSPSVDDSSQDSAVFSHPPSRSSKKKAHAQRKFAQGCSQASTPSSTPGKRGAPPPAHSLLDRIPKTEDFLTFLCLRGSHLLPPHLDFFNFARDEAAMEDGSGRTRDSTPDSASTGSNANDEMIKFSTPATTPSRQQLDAESKAARASAGTPDTARGIVSLRQGLTRKRVPMGAMKPAGTSPSRSKGGERRGSSGSVSPVRKVLEGASRKLTKISPDTDKAPPKETKKTDMPSREERLKNRLKLMAKRRQAIKKVSSKKPLRAPVKRPASSKAASYSATSAKRRRSSVRLKTQARVTGKRRPDYSLVAAGVADLGSDDEEKDIRRGRAGKAARSALDKAKAHARARVSRGRTVRRATASNGSRGHEPDKMRTRSTSSVGSRDTSASERHKGGQQEDTTVG